jgi:HK97 family phage portal protein
MGLRDRMVRWLTKSTAPDWGTLERYLAWAFGGGASSAGIVVNPQTAMQQATVYACVKVLAESIAMLPCVLYRWQGRNQIPATDHPLFEILRWQPNDWQSAVDFWEMIVASLCLRGNGYAWINRTRSGDVAELLPLHPDMINVTMQPGFRLNYQVTMPDGSFKDMAPGEIFHVRGLSLNGWLGISPIAYARESIGLALAAEKFGGQLFRNGAKMGGVLEHPARMSDEAYKRLKESFDRSTSGEHSHETAVLEEGVKFNKISIAPEDAQFLETRKMQRSEIAAVFRVPAHLVNDLEKATFSNIEQLGLQFVTSCLMPWFTRIEQAIRRDLIVRSERKDLNPAFDVSMMLRGDAAARSTYYHNGIMDGWLTRNEARSIESNLGIVLNPIDDLDEPLMPLNMIEVGKEPETPAPAAEPAAPPPEEKPNEAVAKLTDAMQTMERRLSLVHSSSGPSVNIEPAPVTIHVTKEIDKAEPRRVQFLFDENKEVIGAEFVDAEEHTAG